MPNALGADEFVGQLLNIAGTAAQEHHFKTRIVIQMGVQRGDHDFVVLMLKISELLGKKSSLVVID